MANAIPVNGPDKNAADSSGEDTPICLSMPHEAPPPVSEQLAVIPKPLAKQAKEAIDNGARSVYSAGGLLCIQH